MSSSGNTGNTLLALVTGAIIGAGVGLLYAPESGDKTRKKLKQGAKDAQLKLNQKYQETASIIGEKAAKAKVEFESKLEETLSNASYKADDILLAMENKLEELRKKNAKLHKEVTVEKTKTSANKAVV
ncbi:YtxH domain-containing protein [Aquimarina sp. 2-A2]|uniref:YtxH domain-containing protein n=1 Tax=Aquimarina sp. 2-A2 TaxID=3382644 RepID=UPI00387F0C43